MKLFTPINIGKLEVKNRIVMPPMGTGFGSEDGQVTERMINYYEERAKGGAGLIIVEGAAVEGRGRFLPLQPMINHDRFILLSSPITNGHNSIRFSGARRTIYYNYLIFLIF